MKTNSVAEESDNTIVPFQPDVTGIIQENATVRPSTVTCDRRGDNPFRWSKSPAMNWRALSATAKLEAAIAMETTLKQKDKVIRTLGRRLRKSNEEKYHLISELSGFRGPDREKLCKENCILRERLERVTRESLMLRGLDRRSKNSRI